MLNNVFFWLSIYLHAYNEVGVKQARMSVFCTAYIIKMASTCAGITFLIFMGFSRVYLGAHTYNQVLFGTLLGAVLALVGHYKVKPLFLAMPEYLYSDEQGSKYGVTIKSYFKVVGCFLVFPFLLALTIAVLSPDYHNYIDMNMIKRVLAAGCTLADLTPAHALHLLHFQRAGSIAIVAGSLCGQIFEYRFFVNTGAMNNSAWVWNKTSITKTILRIILTSLMMFFCLAPRAFA